MSKYEPKNLPQALTTMILGFLVLSPLLWIISISALHLGNAMRENNKKYYAPAIEDYQKGDYADCQKELNIYLGIENDNYYAHYLMGLCYLREGNISKADWQFQDTVNYSLANTSERGGSINADNDHLLHDDAQQMLFWIQQNPGNVTPPANFENMKLIRSIEHIH